MTILDFMKRENKPLDDKMKKDTDTELIFHFERGAYFAGMLDYKIEKIENSFIFVGRFFNDFAWMDDIEFILPEEEIINLWKILLPIKKWKKEYEAKEKILDGYNWGIHFSYADENISSCGYEAFPNNYRRMIGKLQKHIEKLGKKYNDNYQEEGVRERLKL